MQPSTLTSPVGTPDREDPREILIRMQLLEEDAERIAAEVRRRLAEALQPVPDVRQAG